VKAITEGDLAELPFLEGSIAAIYSLFPDTTKFFDMIFLYGIGMRPTRNRSPQEPPQREDL
jgi:hypothetical protein